MTPPLRATTADRDRTIDRLTGAFAAGALDESEFERRVALAHNGTTVADLAALAADLPGDALVPVQRNALVPTGDVRPTGVVVTVFGAVERKGAWQLARDTRVVTVFGSGEIDLRDARLPPGRFDLRVVAVFGSVEVIVPPHLAVESEGTAVLGAFEHVDRAPAGSPGDAPALRVTGVSVFGSVSIEMRLPGEDARDAHRRRHGRRRLGGPG